MLENPPVVPHGFIRGRFVDVSVDTPADADRLPDSHALRGAVTFSPVVNVRHVGDPEPTTVTQRAVTKRTNPQGYVTDGHDETPGVWLPVGRYDVSTRFSNSTVKRAYQIEVTDEHTEDTPLDLTLAAPIILPPAAVEVVTEETRLRAETAAGHAEDSAGRSETFAQASEASAVRAETAAEVPQEAIDRIGELDSMAQVIVSRMEEVSQKASRAADSANDSSASASESKSHAERAEVQAGHAEENALGASASAEQAKQSADRLDSFLADNAERFVTPNDRLKLNSRVSILEFSESVSGGDWTQAIHAALSAASQVVVPRGTYPVSNLSIPEGRMLSGEPGAILKLAPSMSGSGITLLEGSTLDGVQVDGSGGGQSSSSLVTVMARGKECTLHEVTVFNSYAKAIVVEIGADRTRVANCTVRDSGLVGSCDAFTLKASHLTVSGCHVLRQGPGHAFRTGRYFSDPEVEVTDITISNCMVYASKHNAFTTELGSKFICISSCMVYDAPQAVKGEDASDVSVLNSIFRKITISTAWNMGAVARGVFKGNQLIDSEGAMVLGEGAVCEGNSLVRINDLAIRAERGAVITGNTIDDCGNASAGAIVLIGHASYPNGRAVFSNNTVRRPRGNATTSMVTVSAVRGASITGNVLSGPLPRGIRLVGSVSHVSVSGNVILDVEQPILDGSAAPKYVANNI